MSDNKQKRFSDSELIHLADAQRQKAYVPYSHFHVGAALITGDGRVYTGCNIENSSYGATNCAERTAIFKAVSEGSRQVSRLAVVCDQDQPCMPCGICRQVIAEFASADFELLAASPNGEYKRYAINELLPDAFRLT